MFAPHTNPESRGFTESISPKGDRHSQSEICQAKCRIVSERDSHENRNLANYQMEIPRKSAPLRIPQKRLQTSNALFDPNLSSPPNEFIQNLKLRMDVYFSTPDMRQRR